MIDESELLQDIHAAVEQFWTERLSAAERQRLYLWQDKKTLKLMLS